MKHKNTIIKFLIILIAFELIIDILKLIIPAQIQSLQLSNVLIVIQALFFILLLEDLYKNKAKFGFTLLAVVAFPIIIQSIQVGLGNIFIHFCPEQTNVSNEQGLTGLINMFVNNNCPFPTTFDFYSYIEYPVFCIKQFFSTSEFAYFWGFLFSPYVVYFFLFFKFSLFKLFKENNKIPYLSLIPIVNNVTLLKICKFPASWIFILLIPFVRLFWLYKINKRLCEIQNINSSNAIWMTLFPLILYGKLVFK